MDYNKKLGDILRQILQDRGEEVFHNSQFVLAMFSDLAPMMKKEKELLRAFLDSGGAVKILNVKNAGKQQQKHCIEIVVQTMMDTHWVSEGAAQHICGEFYRAVTNCEWIFESKKNKAPVMPAELDVRKSVTVRQIDLQTDYQVKIEVDGKTTDLKIPAHVNNGQTVCYPGKGRFDSANNIRGDLYVTVNVIADTSSGGTKKIVAAVAAVLVLVIACVSIFSGRSEQKDGYDTPSINNSTVKNEGANKAPSHTHSWQNATCYAPKTCSSCGATTGGLGHQWKEATYTEPKTCRLCGATEGSKLVPKSVYINELKPVDKYGKIWTMSRESPDYYVHTDVNDAEDYKDMNTPGHTKGPVYDYLGNSYTYGIHVDGDEFSEYYLSYDIGGIYSTFTGTCCMSEDMDGDSRASKTKYFEVYGDAVLLFRSLDMSKGSSPQKFSIDISGVEILTIRYPKTSGPSRIATIFDGKLS